MAPVLIGSFTHGSEQWHAARMKGLGGSEIGAVMGLSPWESRFSLYHRKRGDVGQQEENPQMQWGKRLEPAILAKFKEEHAIKWSYDRKGTYCHHERPWQIANPDMWEPGQSFVVDAKFSPMGDDFGEAGTDRVPPHIRAQLMWYMDVLEVETAYVALLVMGCDYREYRIEYDPREAETLRAAGRQFLDEVEQGIRPKIDEHAETYSVIKEMHPDIDGMDVELSNRAARDLIASKRELEAAMGYHQRARSVVADEMGDAQRAFWDGQKIADRRSRGGVPYVQIASKLPELSIEESAA